jgi:hypothetical protein
MRNKLATALIWIAAIAFVNIVIGVFGLRPAMLALMLLVSVACVVATLPENLEDLL